VYKLGSSRFLDGIGGMALEVCKIIKAGQRWVINCKSSALRSFGTFTRTKWFGREFSRGLSQL
jgi:hypothetical protein